MLGAAGAGAHRVWVGPERRLNALGGSWSEPWGSLDLTTPTSGGVHDREWSIRADCWQCQRSGTA
jgi:hypothetical protein